MPRKVALFKVKKKTSEKRPVFATKFDPRIPALQPMIAKYWRAMTQEKYMKGCFSQPPLIAFRRQTNCRDLIIKSRVPRAPRPYPSRTEGGMTKCGKSCPACPYILPTKTVKIDTQNIQNKKKIII